MRGNKKNRYSRRMCFIFDKKQLDSLSSITGGSNFVSALNNEKTNINSKKTMLKHRSQYYQYEWHLETHLEKVSSGIHYFISKHYCYFEPFGYVMVGWAVLDLSSILFIKLELHCRRFAPLCNSKILFHKI